METKPPLDTIVEMRLEDVESLFKKYKLETIHRDFFEKISLLVIASFGLITAIAWDQALKVIFEELFGGLETIHEKLLYAFIITVLATTVSIILSKLFLNRKNKAEKSITDHVREFIPKR
jgi:ABC-type uncharacterized transport system ATPase subunit